MSRWRILALCLWFASLAVGTASAQESFPTDLVRIHYERPDGDYDGFELHVWEDTIESVTWEDGLDITGFDDYGPYWDVRLTADAERMGFIVHRGDDKDPGPDQFLDFDEMGREAWIVSGSTTVHTQRPDIRRAGAGDLGQAQAHWVLPDLIAWKVGTLVPETSFTLHVSGDAGLALSDEGVTGGTAHPLAHDAAGLPGAVLERFPHLAGYQALRLDPADVSMVPDMLRGQLAVAMTTSGQRMDATGLQLPGVLDALYGGFAADALLGPHWQDGIPALFVWAPTAQTMRLHRYGPGVVDADIRDMRRDGASGVWSVRGDADWLGSEYLYEITVYAPSTGRIETNLVTDPYSVSLSMNSSRSRLTDLDDPRLVPATWASLEKPGLAKFEDASIYEIHQRDFSVGDPGVPEEHRGTYLAFTHEDSAGMQHLRALRDAGLSHLHLLPTFDIATIDENPANRVEPSIPAIDVPSDAPDPQAAVYAVRDLDAFNWGYDPYHYNVPEGSYATLPDGDARILEFREMVVALNGAGLRVVVDVVYNHTNAAGQSPRSVLDRVVPGYYHRLDANGFVTTSTCCPNTATEHTMMEKLMVDSVVLWATRYRVDGFRFDLMGHHMLRNMRAVRTALDALTLEHDGVDGTSIYVYGEGWNFGEVADNARGVTATQLDIGGLGIGTFNDRLRDAVRGGGCCPSGRSLFDQGFGNGLHWLPNAFEERSSEQTREALLHAADQIRVGLTGNLRDFRFTGRGGDDVRGSDVDYFGQPTGYALDPQEVVTYVSKHDNQTLFDIHAYGVPTGTSMADRIRMQHVSLSLVALSQGVPFFHAGSDLLRSKSLDRNSYNSGDWFNRIDFTYQTNNFGVGLPMASENRGDWQYMRPLLVDPSLVPAPDDIERSVRLFQEWLANLDPRAEKVLVVVNATSRRQTTTVAGTAGSDFRLHPVQQASVADLLRSAAFYTPSGRVSVPALTTAVFVLPE